MMVVPVNMGGSFQSSKPRLLWTGRYAQGLGSQCGPPGTTSSNYDVTPGGERFLMIKQDEVAPAQINVVLNWTEGAQAKPADQVVMRRNVVQKRSSSPWLQQGRGERSVFANPPAGPPGILSPNEEHSIGGARPPKRKFAGRERRGGGHCR
jgi:hypothetical protein